MVRQEVDSMTDAKPLVNRDSLKAAMPDISSKALDLSLGALVHACREREINTPLRVSAFLGQLAHESGQLRFMTEFWGPTPAQLKYEKPWPKSVELGNTEAGDGFRYRGRGPIQITGRANYRKFGKMLGVDLEAHPERAAWYGIGCRIAAAFWWDRDLNVIADEGTLDAIRRITKRINGGYTGLDKRIAHTNTARVALGLAPLNKEAA
jgi:putative chitinase